MTAASNIVRIGDGRVRLSDDELHKQACKAIWEGNHVVFESLPSLIARIIEHKTWRSYQHKDFASYALDATSNGLGVNTNQRLWILRCSMDVQGKHIKEWADVLAKVETLVRLYAAEEGKSIRSFGGNSLEALAKVGEDISSRITYLPSRQGGTGTDCHLMRLRKKPDVFKRVLSGELSMVEARRSAGIPVKPTDTTRAKSLVRNMTAKERREFIAWLREEGFLE
jgi:hypothetical protein